MFEVERLTQAVRASGVTMSTSEETLFADLPQSHAIPIEYPVIVNNHNAAGELDEFVDCIVNDKPIHTTAVEGAKTVKASLAAVESSKTGMPVKIEYDF